MVGTDFPASLQNFERVEGTVSRSQEMVFAEVQLLILKAVFKRSPHRSQFPSNVIRGSGVRSGPRKVEKKVDIFLDWIC